MPSPCSSPCPSRFSSFAPSSFSSPFLAPFASAAPFVIAIGGASVYVKNAEYRHYNRLEQQHQSTADEEAALRVVTNKRTQSNCRTPTLRTFFSILLVGMGIIAGLAFIGWTIHRMNEQHKMCVEVMKMQSERIGQLENAMTKQMQMGESEAREEEEPKEKRTRKSDKAEDEQQFAVTDQGNADGRRNRPKHSLPGASRDNGGRDFVIFVKGRPMSGRQFAAQGPKGS